MFDKSFSGVLLSSATSPLFTDCGDLDLDLSAPLSYTDLKSDGTTKSKSKPDFGDPLDLSAPLSYTNIIHDYTTHLRSSCSLNLPLFSGSSDIFKFHTSKRSLCITGGLLATEKRKYSAEEDGRCKTEKKFCYEGSTSERGIKRKHWSEHTEHTLKRLKKQHKTEHPNFLIPCPSTCACHVGPLYSSKFYWKTYISLHARSSSAAAKSSASTNGKRTRVITKGNRKYTIRSGCLKHIVPYVPDIYIANLTKRAYLHVQCIKQ